jgi:hypothetical protein
VPAWSLFRELAPGLLLQARGGDAMPRDPQIRARRHAAIQKIFEQGQEIREQKDLLRLLAVEGFEMTQSSVSRDLRHLGGHPAQRPLRAAGG